MTESRRLPTWERIVRRMLAEGVNFDKPHEGMQILREVLGPPSVEDRVVAWLRMPVPCKDLNKLVDGLEAMYGKELVMLPTVGGWTPVALPAEVRST